jgi:uncharacterized protein (DUF433 family)
LQFSGNEHGHGEGRSGGESVLILEEKKERAMDWHHRIVVNPKVLVGKPVIKGTRIAVEFLMELLANGWTHEQILKNYPHLTEEDIQAALHYATEVVKQEHVYPLPV